MKLVVIVMCKSQQTGTANQSQHISYFGRSGFIETGTKDILEPEWGEMCCNNECNKAITPQ